MTGNFIDSYRFGLMKTRKKWKENINLISSDFGRIRVLDTKSNKPVIINVPDGPNVIEHHEKLINELSKNFRVICFELPGTGFSFPNSKYDYSLVIASKLIINIMDILKLKMLHLLFHVQMVFMQLKQLNCFLIE